MDGRSKTPSPTPGSPRPAVKNILKSVECHVRLMSHLENTSTSSSYTAVRLKNAQADTWTDAFNVTRVHRATPTDQFYQEVIAPCVANSLAGQSYLFLVSGPCESGRSQTLYGSPHHSERGIIELAAEELLRHTPSHEEARDVTGRKNATVTHSAFVTRGDQMQETVTGQPVPLVEFPPPLGPTALPPMRLLESAAGAVQIPAKKHTDTSCVVQFHVYAPVDATGRRSMATLTFVDVAAFRPPLCGEVRHVVETVRRVSGLAAGEPRFRHAKLTSLLEPALVGYVTLVSVSTISGRADLHAAACEALHFAEALRRIHQVLMLVHIHTPRWFPETAERVEELRAQRGRLLAEQHARGVHDFYRAACGWLAAHVGDTGGAFDRLLAETAAVRAGVGREVAEAAEAVGRRVSEALRDGEALREESRRAHAAAAAQVEAVKRLDETVAGLEQQLAQRDLCGDHRVRAMRIEISAMESETGMRRQELSQLEKEERLYAAKFAEVHGVMEKYAEDLAHAQLLLAHAKEMEAMAQKRRRLEADLAIASQVAHRRTDTLRADRERRSKLSRLTIMQQKVDALRERVRGEEENSNSPATSRKRVYSSPRYSAM